MFPLVTIPFIVMSVSSLVDPMSIVTDQTNRSLFFLFSKYMISNRIFIPIGCVSKY